jgi:xanthine phosphoribosyltransferase
MERLVKKIKEEAYVIDNKIIKVDHFINHMLDTDLVFDIGEEFALKFPEATKILTIEASGIAFAVSTAFHLGHIPIVFARKNESLITTKKVYASEVYSFTKQKVSNVIVDREFLSSNDKVLIIDDFLALGNATNGLIDIAEQAGAEIVGVGIVIEKGFQQGRKELVKKGIKVHSLANIKSIVNNELIFEKGESDV